MDNAQSKPQTKIPRYGRKKLCMFCADKTIKIKYENTEVLQKFITERAKILPRRITGVCARHQRMLKREIKRARVLALLPFVR